MFRALAACKSWYFIEHFDGVEMERLLQEMNQGAMHRGGGSSGKSGGDGIGVPFILDAVAQLLELLR